jgi:hypothetical protein
VVARAQQPERLRRICCAPGPVAYRTGGGMLRNVLLFFTALLLALTAGRAFWAWLGENPFNISGQTYGDGASPN